MRFRRDEEKEGRKESETEREWIPSGGANAKDPPRIQRAARNVHRASVRNASVSLCRHAATIAARPPTRRLFSPCASVSRIHVDRAAWSREKLPEITIARVVPPLASTLELHL